MSDRSPLQSTAAALHATVDVDLSLASPVAGNVVFVGSGDSLSSALIGTRFGHRAVSSGDITWMNQLPVGADTIVGISHSGNSGATVRSLQLARAAGLRAVAVTSNIDSPLARAASEVQLVPKLGTDHVLPNAGHLMLSLGVAAVAGAETSGLSSAIARYLEDGAEAFEATLEGIPEAAPESITVLTLPELRGAGDFWALKLIEATGVSVRNVPLEESGHVDYFTGPQSHLELQLVGSIGTERFAELARALSSTGQKVQSVTFAASSDVHGLVAELGVAVFGSVYSLAAASKWDRPTFRGGAVNMDAKHITFDAEAVSEE